MTLAFINPSRSFDETRNAVRFSGHDGMFEVDFYVDAAALTSARATRHDAAFEAACLKAFDAARTAIHNAALRVYTGGRRPYYTLTSSDLPKG